MTVVSRRSFITASASMSTLIVAGCQNEPCVVTSDSMANAICRQRKWSQETRDHVTAAMLIGAALGAGIAIALRGNPLVGAIGGAMVAGGATAIDRYISYRYDQANGDEGVARDAVQFDCNSDLARSRITRDDAVAFRQRCIDELNNKSKSIFAAAESAAQAKAGADIASKNGRTFEITAPVLQGAALHFGISSPALAGNLQEMYSNGSDTKKQAILIDLFLTGHGYSGT